MSSDDTSSPAGSSIPCDRGPAWWAELWRTAAAQARPPKEFLGRIHRATRVGGEDNSWPWSVWGSDGGVRWFYNGLRAAADALLARRNVLAPEATPFLETLFWEAPARWSQDYEAHRQAASTDPEAYIRIGGRLIAVARQLADDCVSPGPVALAVDWLLSAGTRLLLEMADPGSP